MTLHFRTKKPRVLKGSPFQETLIRQSWSCHFQQLTHADPCRLFRPSTTPRKLCKEHPRSLWFPSIFHPPIFGNLCTFVTRPNKSLLLRSTTLKSNQSNWSFSGPDSPPLESLENEHPSFKTSGKPRAKAPMQVSVLNPLSTANLVFSATWLLSLSAPGDSENEAKKTPKGRSHFNISLSSRRTGKSCGLTWFFIIWKNSCFIKTHQWI